MPTWLDRTRHLAGRLGGSRDGEFTAGGLPISHLAEECGTPLYLYHGDSIIDRVRRVRKALGREVEIFYSVKANPSLGICRLLADTGLVGAEIASAGELVLARAAGFEPEDIVFAGPGKTDEELHRAVEEGIFAVNVESLGEIDRLGTIAGRCGREAGVGLRINPGVQLMGSQMRMGGGASQFGLDQSELGEAIRKVLEHGCLQLTGIHVYTATQVFDHHALLDHCQNILEIALQAADSAGGTIEMVDLGGGFGVPYFENMGEFDLEGFGLAFQELLTSYRSHPALVGCRFLFELGRYLVAESGVYVMQVMDVKRSRGKTFVVTDGGMNHHSAATGNFGGVFRKSYPLLNLSRLGGEKVEVVAVSGPCCTPLDNFGASIQMVQPEVGDLIGVFYSGAYGYSASKLAFLSHPTPAEVLLSEDKVILLRPGSRPEDVLRGQEMRPILSCNATLQGA